MQALVLIDYNKTHNRGLISHGWLHISGNVKIAINYFYLFKKLILTFHLGTQLHLLQEVKRRLLYQIEQVHLGLILMSSIEDKRDVIVKYLWRQ